jgi:mRNA-degrading endonuclease toxin of MazEF toxin-antitoxin module
MPAVVGSLRGLDAGVRTAGVPAVEVAMLDRAPWSVVAIVVAVAVAVAVAAAAAAALWWWRGATRAGGPRPGDIWWADVPFADGSASKVRPCLVLSRSRGAVVVLKITSQDKSRRRDHVLIPTRSWDPRARHDSYLNLGEPITVAASAFVRRAGGCDPQTWRRARRARHTLRPQL